MTKSLNLDSIANEIESLDVPVNKLGTSTKEMEKLCRLHKIIQILFIRTPFWTDEQKDFIIDNLSKYTKKLDINDPLFKIEKLGEGLKESIKITCSVKFCSIFQKIAGMLAKKVDPSTKVFKSSSLNITVDVDQDNVHKDVVGVLVFTDYDLDRGNGNLYGCFKINNLETGYRTSFDKHENERQFILRELNPRFNVIEIKKTFRTTAVAVMFCKDSSGDFDIFYVNIRKSDGKIHKQSGSVCGSPLSIVESLVGKLDVSDKKDLIEEIRRIEEVSLMASEKVGEEYNTEIVKKITIRDEDKTSSRVSVEPAYQDQDQDQDDEAVEEEEVVTSDSEEETVEIE